MKIQNRLTIKWQYILAAGLLCEILVVFVYTLFTFDGTYQVSPTKDFQIKSLETPQTCIEEQHIYFLKIHKTASTTVANIFLRYAFSRNLSILVFPDAKYSHPLWNFTHLLPGERPPGRKYDMYLEHSIYDASMLQRVLHNHTQNIALIREPLSRFLSSFTYFRIYNHVNMNKSSDMVEKFLQNPKFYLSQSKYRFARDMTKNTMSLAFGYVPGYVPGRNRNITEYLSYIESRFLVLIMERLPESLVLMR